MTAESIANNHTLTLVARASNIFAAALLAALVAWGFGAGERISALETEIAVIQATQAQSSSDRRDFQDQTGAQLNAINKSLVELSNSTAALNATITQLERR